MRRGWKIVVGVLTAIVVLVVVNMIVTDRDTEPAKADGGRIIDLPGGDLQVREDGPVNGPPIVLLHGWAALERLVRPDHAAARHGPPCRPRGPARPRRLGKAARWLHDGGAGRPGRARA